MKQLLTGLLLICSYIGYGQKPGWQLSFQLQPEMTCYKESYYWHTGNPSKNSLNVGGSILIQRNIGSSFFINSGLGFISRKLNTSTFLNQAALPPPNQSFTMELVTTKSIANRTLFLPVTVGYNVFLGKTLSGFVTTGFTANYLLNTYYRSNFSKYNGAYKKNYWQGYSLNAGLGADYKINNKIAATSSLSYAFVNTVKPDDYLLTQNGDGRTLSHKFLTLNIGVKVSL
ncbi:MAG: hypothetical protein V4722_05455 [Bacteroidota bacterium]